MMRQRGRHLLVQLERVLRLLELSGGVEEDYIQIARCFEATRQRCCRLEQDGRWAREQLARAEAERAALEVKLKHARNQVEVEMKKRHRAEAELEKQERKLQLVFELLMQEPSGSAVLTGEQRSVLSALAGRCLGGALAPGRRSSVVDESCHSLLSHSDISYDRTEDDVVVDVTVVKTLKRKAQERQRASLAPQIGPVVVAKRHRPSVAPPNAASVPPAPPAAGAPGPAGSLPPAALVPRRRSRQGHRLSTRAGRGEGGGLGPMRARRLRSLLGCGVGQLWLLPSLGRVGTHWEMLASRCGGSRVLQRPQMPPSPGQPQCCRGSPERWGASPGPSRGHFTFWGPPRTVSSLGRADHGVGHQRGSGLLCPGAGERHRGRLCGAASASPLPLPSAGPRSPPASVRLQNGACLPPSLLSGRGGRARGWAALSPASGGLRPVLGAALGPGRGGERCGQGRGKAALTPPAPRQIIRPEPCAVCGCRVRFGKAACKCRRCQLLVHAKCRERCPGPCAPRSRQRAWPREGVLADFAPPAPPLVPALVARCVAEVETRGLTETGLYRVPGTEQLVREWKRRLLRAGDAPPGLGAVADIHVVCGVLKDFLRGLKEPLVTFSLHPAFLQAADIPDEAACGTALCRLVSELPPANRDTLAFLMLHLLRVSRSPECRMDVLNLSRVFGPTLVGHSSANPTPLTIMEDTPRQCKVVAQLLSLPPDFWRRFVGMEQENPAPLPASTPAPDGTPGSEREQLFCPITSPESNSGQLSPAGTCCLPSTLRSCVGTPAQPPQGPAPRNVGWFFPSLV